MTRGSKNWRTRERYEHDHGSIAKQDGPGGEVRLRIDIDGIDSVYIKTDTLFNLAELLDDFCDAVEDGEFNIDPRHAVAFGDGPRED